MPQSERLPLTRHRLLDLSYRSHSTPHACLILPQLPQEHGHPTAFCTLGANATEFSSHSDSMGGAESRMAIYHFHFHNYDPDVVPSLLMRRSLGGLHANDERGAIRNCAHFDTTNDGPCFGL